MISVLVRSSIWTSPRAESTACLTSGAAASRAGVAERERAHRQRRRRRAADFGQRLPRVLLLAQRVQRRDADDGAVDGVVELIAAQDDVERLVPRHVVEDDVDRALHVGVDDHVQAADLGEAAQHGAQVGALEVEADRVAGELLLAAAAADLLHLLGARLRRRRRRRGRRRARLAARRRRRGVAARRIGRAAGVRARAAARPPARTPRLAR